MKENAITEVQAEEKDSADLDPTLDEEEIGTDELREELDEGEADTGTDSFDRSDTEYYARLAREDMEELIRIFPHRSGKRSVTELENPLRYAALRDLGLTPKEAYLATSGKASKYDTRSHLRSSVPIGAARSSESISTRELDEAREIFGNLSDREIHSLYKRVNSHKN